MREARVGQSSSAIGHSPNPQLASRASDCGLYRRLPEKQNVLPEKQNAPQAPV